MMTFKETPTAKSQLKCETLYNRTDPALMNSALLIRHKSDEGTLADFGGLGHMMRQGDSGFQVDGRRDRGRSEVT